MNKAFAPLLASALLLALPAHAEDKSSGGDKDYVMLKVNGEDIKKSEIDEAWKDAGKMMFPGGEAPSFESMEAPQKENFLRIVASEHVLYKEAQKANLEDTPETKALYEKLKRQALIEQLLKEKTKEAVTDEKLKEAYDEQVKVAQAGSDNREYHARHILVKTQEEAEALAKKVKGGADFEKLAKEKSEDKSSGVQGGDLGWFSPGNMAPEFSSVVVKLKKGEVSQPVKTDFGWHIIQLEDSRKVTPPAFKEVKGLLKQKESNRAVGEYVNAVMKSAKIVGVDSHGKETEISAVAAAPKADVKASAKKGEKEDKSDKKEEKGDSE